MDWLIAAFIFSITLAVLMHRYKPGQKISKQTKQRGFLLLTFYFYWVLVAIGVIASDIIFYFSQATHILKTLPPLWLLMLNNIFYFSEFVCVMAIWKWQKWGLYGFLFLQLIEILLSFATRNFVPYTYSTFIKDLILFCVYISIFLPYWHSFEDHHQED